MSTARATSSVYLTLHSFTRLRAGERQAILIKLKSSGERADVIDLVVEYINSLTQTFSDLERAFLLGRELSSFWPEDLKQDLAEQVIKLANPRIKAAFLQGFGQEKVDGAVNPPSEESLRALVDALKKKGVAATADEVHRVFEAHLRYTASTGYSVDLANAASRLAAALLRRPQQERFEGGAIAQSILRSTLHWEPWNARLWNQWANSYIAQGAREAGELILWEANRRFPENVYIAASLIRLVGMHSDRLEEALEICERSVIRLRGSVVLNNIRARLLIRAGHFDRGLTVLAENLKNMNNVDADSTLFARGLSELYQKQELTASSIEKIINLLPNEPIALGKIARALKQQEASKILLENFYRAGLKHCPSEFLEGGLAALLVFSGDSIRAEEGYRLLGKILEQNPDNDFARRIIAKVNENREATELEMLAEPTVERSDEDDPSFAAEIETLESIGEELSAPVQLWPSLPEEVSRLGTARRIQFRLRAANDNVRSHAHEELLELLRTDPTFAYNQLLAVRQRIWDTERFNLMTFPAAFELALGKEDKALLQELGRRFKREEALTILARAIFGDGEAAAQIKEMMSNPGAIPTDLGRRSIARLRPWLKEDWASGASLSPARRKTYIDALRELNEWALAGGALGAVA